MDSVAGLQATQRSSGVRGLAAAERAESELLPKQFETAWEAFADAVDDDVATQILAAAHAPTRLAHAMLDAGPATLLHGDLRDDNLGLRDDRVVLLDWELATAGTPTVEFAWYLCHEAWRIDATHDQLEADYRARPHRPRPPRSG
jgi:aminoglycoside phosphotransferase (APT) family kinase protein